METYWECVEYYSGPCDVWPIFDLRGHERGMSCWCHPTLDDGEIVVHNSLDRRELYETGQLRLS